MKQESEVRMYCTAETQRAQRKEQDKRQKDKGTRLKEKKKRETPKIRHSCSLLLEPLRTLRLCGEKLI